MAKKYDAIEAFRADNDTIGIRLGDAEIRLPVRRAREMAQAIIGIADLADKYKADAEKKKK